MHTSLLSRRRASPAHAALEQYCREHVGFPVTVDRRVVNAQPQQGHGAALADRAAVIAAFRALPPEERGLLQSISQARAVYTQHTPQERMALMLQTAQGAGGVPFARRAWIGFSPFGWHGPEFLALQEHLPILHTAPDADQPLRVACYGAGFHSDTRFYVDASLNDGEDEIPGALGPVVDAERALYGAQHSTSHEPRELLALFLAGEQPGSLSVFDAFNALAAEFAAPRFAWLNGYHMFRAAAGQDPIPQSFADRYWNYLASERNVTREDHGQILDLPLQSHSFRFTDDEWAKLHLCHLDLACDLLSAASEWFDLSVCLQTLYFIPAALQPLTLGQIVDRTRMGGYIYCDTMSPSAMHLFGLQPALQVERSWASDTPITAYRRMAHSPFVDVLAASLRPTV